jgi:hypothetical protein
MEEGQDGGGPRAGRGRPRPRCRVGVVHELVRPPQASPPPAPPPRVTRRCSYTFGSTTPRCSCTSGPEPPLELLPPAPPTGPPSSSPLAPKNQRRGSGWSERARGIKRRRAMPGTLLTSSGHLLLPSVPVAAHPPCRHHPSPGRTAHCTAGRRVSAEGGGDRLEREETTP